MSSEDRSLRNALGQFATGVCVVTAQPGDKPAFGLTINSFSSVSLEPPLVLWSIGKSSTSFDDFMSVDQYTINVLGAEQKDLSNKYASKDKLLADEHCDASNPGFPAIEGAIAKFHCEVAHRYDGGDHLIIVGRVLKFDAADDAQPLIFYAGSYSSLAA